MLVVSGTGFIGANVVRALAAAGHEVTVYHRGQTEPDLPAGVRHVRADSARLPVTHYPAFLRAAGFDAVILMVPLGDEDARAAVEAFRGVAGRIVAISSGDVYAAHAQLLGSEPVQRDAAAASPLLDEDAPLRRDLYPYGRSVPGPWGGDLLDYDKILVERAVLTAADLPGTVLRLPAVYGPGDRQHRFASYIRRMADGRPFLLLGEPQARWRWTHGYVENVAAAIVLAATHDAAASRIYNVGELNTPNFADRLYAIGRAMDWRGAVVTVPQDHVPAHLRESVNYATDLAMDTARIRRELGYSERVAEDDGLRRSVEWERTQPSARSIPSSDYEAEDRALRHAL